jgi:aspartyl/glutamyl-tRNA(Asn/Gln) amidotransferase C subunit
VFRDDVVRKSIDRKGIEQNAPSFVDGFFVVPKIIE